MLLDAAGKEDELESGAVPDVEHLVPSGVEVGLNLVAVPEAQRELRCQLGAVSVEGPVHRKLTSGPSIVVSSTQLVTAPTSVMSTVR